MRSTAADMPGLLLITLIGECVFIYPDMSAHSCSESGVLEDARILQQNASARRKHLRDKCLESLKDIRQEGEVSAN